LRDVRLLRAIALVTALFLFLPRAAAAANAKTVVVLYPENAEGSPGSTLANESLRATFAAGSPEPIQIRHEYLDLSRFHDTDQRRLLADFLQHKYADQSIDLVVTGLASSLEFVLEYRDEIFPGVPVVFMAVDERELAGRTLPADVIGVPIKMDLAGTLDLALSLHPRTRRVFVVAGHAKFDAYWDNIARQTFRPYEDRLEFVYLSGLRMDDLLSRVAQLPRRALTCRVR